MSKFRRFHATVKIPNQLILDASLSYSARRLGAVLYSRRNALGYCRMSLARLAGLSRLSVTTTRKAIEELDSKHYIAYTNTYRYNEQRDRMVYAANAYQCLLSVSKGYTLVPWTLFDATLQNSAFVAALYLYLQTGNSTRCWPSLRTICQDIGASVSTICRAIKALGIVNLLLALHCKRANQTFNNNSYHILFNGARLDVDKAAAGVRHQSDRMAPFPSHFKHSIFIRILQAFLSLFRNKGYFQNWQTILRLS